MIVNPVFDMGKLVVTRAIDEKMRDDAQFRNFVYASLGRYAKKDWGEMAKEDLERNNEALLSGEERIFAAYKRAGSDEKIWIITEWDRSVTTVLFPEDY